MRKKVKRLSIVSDIIGGIIIFCWALSYVIICNTSSTFHVILTAILGVFITALLLILEHVLSYLEKIARRKDQND